MYKTITYALTFMLALSDVRAKASDITETQMVVVKSVAISGVVEGRLVDFDFCRDGRNKFILYPSDTLRRIDLQTKNIDHFPISSLSNLAVSPDCTLILSSAGISDDNGEILLQETEFATGEVIGEFHLPAEVIGFNQLLDVTFDPTSGHLFLLVPSFDPFNEGPAILEFDKNQEEIVRAIPVPLPVGASDLRNRFTINPENGELFLDFAGNDESHHRLVGRFSPDGALLEIFQLPILPLGFRFCAFGEGLAFDPSTEHLFVYGNGVSGHGFFELAPVVTAADQGWEQYE